MRPPATSTRRPQLWLQSTQTVARSRASPGSGVREMEASTGIVAVMADLRGARERRSRAGLGAQVHAHLARMDRLAAARAAQLRRRAVAAADVLEHDRRALRVGHPAVAPGE